MKKLFGLLFSMLFIVSSCNGPAAEALQYKFDTANTALLSNGEDVHIKMKQEDAAWYNSWQAVDHTSIIVYILTGSDIDLNLSNGIKQAQFSIDGKTQDSTDYFINVTKIVNHSDELFTIIECDFHLLDAIESLEFITLKGRFTMAIELRKGTSLLNIHRELDLHFLYNSETSTITAL